MVWHLPLNWTLAFWEGLLGQGGSYVATALDSEQDLAAVAAVHGGAFAHAWDEDEFAALIAQPGTFGFVAQRAGHREPEGLVLARLVVDEAEILTIAVDRSARGKGVGKLLSLPFTLLGAVRTARVGSRVLSRALSRAFDLRGPRARGAARASARAHAGRAWRGAPHRRECVIARRTASVGCAVIVGRMRRSLSRPLRVASVCFGSQRYRSGRSASLALPSASMSPRVSE